MNHIFPHPSVSYKVAYIAIPDISHIWIWEKMWSVVFPGITINLFGNSNFCKIRVNIFRVYCCWLLILVSFFFFFWPGPVACRILVPRSMTEWVLLQWKHSPNCREPVRDIPLMTKVMRKEARHTQRRDRASGVPPDILEHLPPQKNQSLPTLLLCALTSDFTGGCPPPPSHSLCQRVNLPLQLIKFLGN